MCSEKTTELLELFNEAETLMKKIEIIYDGYYFAPSSNELRYAFGHYLKYQPELDKIRKNDFLNNRLLPIVISVIGIISGIIIAILK